ncbi:hypothetical protein VPH35_014431 [Triticum aestivum]|uniref:Uncharacterized protein n=1 Tax=Aegilops tauschii TaxID=37682 RepID=M8B032_AEGTA
MAALSCSSAVAANAGALSPPRPPRRSAGIAQACPAPEFPFFAHPTAYMTCSSSMRSSPTSSLRWKRWSSKSSAPLASCPAALGRAHRLRSALLACLEVDSIAEMNIHALHTSPLGLSRMLGAVAVYRVQLPLVLTSNHAIPYGIAPELMKGRSMANRMFMLMLVMGAFSTTKTRVLTTLAWTGRFAAINAG